MSTESTFDKLLFTPGPLTTSKTVKQAMLRDLGSRDEVFIELLREVRNELVALGGVSGENFTAVLMQGSGTFSLEAVLSSTVPPDGKVLIAVNGAYGRRLVLLAETLGIETATLEFPENMPVDPAAVAQALADDPTITHVSICHCETTSGVMNPIEMVGEVVQDAGKRYFVDAMSSFGAVPLNLEEAKIDYLVSSANKCIEGVPGFAFVLARREALEETAGWARSVSLDLLSQVRGLEKNGQFRFTPPTHAILAFRQAIRELHEEGGVEGRGRRYAENHCVLTEGMAKLGFRPYVAPNDQGYIITSFHYPDDPNFDFEAFYGQLSDRGFVIYPGKVGDADCFRIGTIGRLFPNDVRNLLIAVTETLEALDINISA
ncbi:MAG: 2-aminoethylphosphonate--pyruvate transaminase [Planctomycetes bacterium]|nr:2-aminoethylphosphonate--pyruvate transaminase [Planctomycetota bacterium]